jgi:hypothetical protein
MVSSEIPTAAAALGIVSNGRNAIDNLMDNCGDMPFRADLSPFKGFRPKILGFVGLVSYAAGMNQDPSWEAKRGKQ